MLNCHVTHFKLSLCNPLDFKFVIVLHHLSICPMSLSLVVPQGHHVHPLHLLVYSRCLHIIPEVINLAVASFTLAALLSQLLSWLLCTVITRWSLAYVPGAVSPSTCCQNL